MAFPSVTYNFSNGATADADQVDQNFQDIINGISDGTKDISVNAGTFAGNVSISGNTTLGNASSDTITFTGSMASTLPIGTSATYDIGSSTLGLRSIYIGANSQTVRLLGSASMSATWTFTFPVDDGTTSQWLVTDGSGVTSWTNTTTTGKIIDGTADEVQLRVDGHSTQTSDIFEVNKSDATELLAVTNTSGTKIRGTTTNDAAATGFVGETVRTYTAFGSAATLSTGASSNVASISLTAGDWDVTAHCILSGTLTGTIYSAGINTTSASLSGVNFGENASQIPTMSTATCDCSLIIPNYRISISATTTVYLVANVTFTAGTAKAYGTIRARRVR